LYVRNLPYICKEEDIEALFSPFGKYNTDLLMNIHDAGFLIP
jgi:RNA recognition motif-containing protein